MSVEIIMPDFGLSIAEGTIEEGETQTCTINNEVTVTES